VSTDWRRDEVLGAVLAWVVPPVGLVLGVLKAARSTDPVRRRRWMAISAIGLVFSVLILGVLVGR
jgi:hypothetical protein